MSFSWNWTWRNYVTELQVCMEFMSVSLSLNSHSFEDESDSSMLVFYNYITTTITRLRHHQAHAVWKKSKNNLSIRIWFQPRWTSSEKLHFKSTTCHNQRFNRPTPQASPPKIRHKITRTLNSMLHKIC